MAKTEKKMAKLGPRARKLTKKQAKMLAKHELGSQPMPGSFKLLGQVYNLFKTNWKILGGIMLVYLILNVIFASGVTSVSTSFSAVKADIQNSHHLSDGLHGFGSLLSGSFSGGSQSASLLQTLLLVLESLVIIWALRQLLAGKQFSLKDAYYKSMFPLVPFLLIISVIIIQLLPITLGTGFISVIFSALASSGAATALMALVLIPLLAWSFYMLSCSIFALYIVTLPDMQPRQALRSAKKLVNFRRLKIIKRLIFLPIFILVVMAALILPLILFVHVLVVPVFYLLSILVVLFIHTYLYSLYRGLLNG
jgi:hypothetical protein